MKVKVLKDILEKLDNEKEIMLVESYDRNTSVLYLKNPSIIEVTDNHITTCESGYIIK